MKENLIPYSMEFVHQQSSQKLFSVISCFAGGGGSSTGYKLAGGNVLLVNEFVDDAVKTYNKNYPDVKVLPGDIRQYKSVDFLDAANLKVGELDILDGSPPCSAFSVSGKREKGWNKTKKYSDTTQTNVEDLFIDFINIAKDIQPKVIIAENVAGLAQGEPRKRLNVFLNKFERIGYQPFYSIVAAADFGVSQLRRRLIIICVRDDVAEAVGLNFLTGHSTLYPEAITPEHIPLQDAIGDIVNDPEEVQMLLDFVQQSSFQKKLIERFDPIIDKPSNPTGEKFKDINPKGSFFNFYKSSPYTPSPTLTQLGQQKGISGVFHYSENRKFTIKELKRIMGLPDDYELTGTFNKQAERICRMVSPPMMKAISESVYENVIKPYNKAVKNNG